MAALAFVTLILAITAGQSNGNWCVCKSGVAENMLQRALDYACGAGADCNPIHPNGQCYNPNTVKNHCDYAVNSYFQKKGQAQGSCDFAGTATVSASNPSSIGCVYPVSARKVCSTGTSATPSTGTGTTPSTGTGTTPSTGTGTGTSTIPSTTTPSTMNPSTNTPSTTTPSSTSTTTTPYSTTPSTGVFGTGVGPSGAGINTDDSSGLRLVSTSLSLIWLVALVSLTLE